MNVKDDLTVTADDMNKFIQSEAETTVFPSSLNDAISLRASEKNTIRVDDKSECISEQTLLKEETQKIKEPWNDEDDYDDNNYLLTPRLELFPKPTKGISERVRPFPSPAYPEEKERRLRSEYIPVQTSLYEDHLDIEEPEYIPVQTSLYEDHLDIEEPECIPEQTLMKEEIKKIEDPKNVRPFPSLPYLEEKERRLRRGISESVRPFPSLPYLEAKERRLRRGISENDEDDYNDECDQPASWLKPNVVNPDRKIVLECFRPFPTPQYPEVKERRLRRIQRERVCPFPSLPYLKVKERRLRRGISGGDMGNNVYFWKSMMRSNRSYLKTLWLEMILSLLSPRPVLGILDLTHLQSCGFAGLCMTHSNIEELLKHLSVYPEMTEITLIVIKCSDRKSECSGYTLDLQNHKQLPILQLRDTLLSKLVIDMSALQTYICGRLLIPRLEFLQYATTRNKFLDTLSALDSSAIYLIKHVELLSNLEQLSELSLHNADLEDKAIILSPEMSRLRYVWFYFVQMNSPSIMSLISSAGRLTQAVTIMLHKCKIQPVKEFLQVKRKLLQSQSVLIDEVDKLEFQTKTGTWSSQTENLSLLLYDQDGPFCNQRGAISDDTDYACNKCEQSTNAAKAEQLLEEGKLLNMDELQDAFGAFKVEQKALANDVCQKELECISNLDDGIVYTNQAQPKSRELQSNDSAWNDCVQSKNATKAKQLLEEGILPNMDELQDAYIAFKDEQKELVKDLCQNVENYISTINDCIIYAQACYEPNTPDKILFVVYTSDTKDRAIDIGYPCHFRRTGECSEEGDIINRREQKENLSFKTTVYQDLTLCLRMYSPELMEKHSNLISTSVSHFKSSKEQGLEENPCIVLYVTEKGFIPVGEEALPKTLKTNSKDIPTDIREGREVSPSGGPTEEHKDLKIGCRIESSRLPCEGGTIGAFVNHPEHGLCAVTCAHVVLNILEFEQLLKKQTEVKDLVGIQCFQPMPPNICGEVVDIRLFPGTQGKGGMDIAFIKVEDGRRPKTEEFPDIFKSDLENKRNSCLGGLLMRKLKYSNHAVIQDQSELDESKPVVKYGFATNLTSGKIVISGISVKLQLMSTFFTKEENPKLKTKKIKYCLHDQLEIQDDGMEFAKGGDSGSMVFITDNNKKLIALGILTGREVQGTKSYATPIWKIFEEIKSPIPYSLADTSNPLHQIMERLDQYSRQISKLQKSLDDLMKGRIRNS